MKGKKYYNKENIELKSTQIKIYLQILIYAIRILAYNNIKYTIGILYTVFKK